MKNLLFIFVASMLIGISVALVKVFKLYERLQFERYPLAFWSLFVAVTILYIAEILLGRKIKEVNFSGRYTWIFLFTTIAFAVLLHWAIRMAKLF